MNRHLSIFTPFHITSRENNLTRSLAILLMNEPLFLDLFYREVIGKSLGKNLLSKNIIVNTEVVAKNINIEDFGIKKVYGVTLNAVKYKENLMTSRSTEEPRIDLIIQIDEVLIVVEVKPSEEDPREQLNNQIKRLNWGTIDKNFEYKSLIWADILDITFNLYSFRKQLASPSLYLNEFKTFIERNFQHLLPVPKLSMESLDNKKLAERRIMQIKKELNIKIHGDYFDEGVSYILLKDQSIAERCELGLGDEGTLDLFVWPGDNRNQGRKLYKNKFVLEKIIKEIKNQFQELMPELKVNVLGYTYIKFAHIMGQGVYWEDLPIEPTRDVSELFKEVGQMVYKKNPEKWENSKINIMKYVEDKEIFLNKFNNYFEKTNRNFVNINVGNQIKVSFTLKQIEEWEKRNETIDYLKKTVDIVMESIFPKR